MMMKRSGVSVARVAGTALGIGLIVGLAYYVFTAPYTRFPGVRIGGTLTAPPRGLDDAERRKSGPVETRRLPALCHSRLVCAGAEGHHHRHPSRQWLLGEACPCQPRRLAAHRRPDVCAERAGSTWRGADALSRKYGAKYKMPMGYDFKGEIIAGTNEPLHTWEVFYWTPR